MARKKKEYGYDMDDPNDRAMVFDLPFGGLNSKGRKFKKKHMMKMKLL